LYEEHPKNILEKFVTEEVLESVIELLNEVQFCKKPEKLVAEDVFRFIG
jgi:uncharacterized membrane protein